MSYDGLGADQVVAYCDVTSLRYDKLLAAVRAMVGLTEASSLIVSDSGGGLEISLAASRPPLVVSGTDFSHAVRNGGYSGRLTLAGNPELYSPEDLARLTRTLAPSPR